MQLNLPIFDRLAACQNILTAADDRLSRHTKTTAAPHPALENKEQTNKEQRSTE